MPKYNDDSFVPAAPIVRINFTNPNNGNTINVKMLIDSGADETILPQQALKKLGSGLLKRNRKVEDFNGNTYTLPAVLLNMSHFGHHIADKYYPIISTEDNFGLLGRDILNELHIELNGIKLEWKVRNTFI